MTIKRLGPAYKPCASSRCKEVATARLGWPDVDWTLDYGATHARMVMEGYLPNSGAHPDLKGAFIVREYDRP
jgi:hypothetical protein